MSQPTNEDSEPKNELSFTIEILKVIKESQQQHGLRHLDYQRYRSYCTSRLRRVRKTLHFVCGNMRKFQKREINPEDITDSKFLLLPLFSAERAWSFAMQLKQESNNEPRKKFHMINKLKKATKYSSELEKLSQSNKFDARTKLEAQGYNSLILGQFFFETQKWKESLSHFNIAK
jgi:signal recognition particle subunit SRP68